MSKPNIWDNGNGIWRADWLICFASGLLAAWVLTLNQAPSPSINLPPPQTVVYDCTNLEHAPPAQLYSTEHPARYALQRLQAACQEQDNALALTQIWAQDPTAGVVLEPENP